MTYSILPLSNEVLESRTRGQDISLFKGVVHFSKKRCPCHSFFSRKEIKVFDENIPAFFSI